MENSKGEDILLNGSLILKGKHLIKFVGDALPHMQPSNESKVYGTGNNDNLILLYHILC